MKEGTRQIQADRPESYFTYVAELIEEVTGETATAIDAGVTISADAVRKLWWRSTGTPTGTTHPSGIS